MIKAKDFIKTGFSADDAAKLNVVIEPLISEGDKIVVDFSEITIFTTLFFNNVFAKYILQIGPDEYARQFELRNLSELGETTYKHSYENALKYYNMTEESKKAHEEIVENPED